MAKLTQGQSLSTRYKERGFAAVFAVNLSIFKAANKPAHACYMHFDLNAGSGYNPVADCDGSPIVFMHQVRRAAVPRFRAYFCEREADSLKQLMRRPELQAPECECFWGDNQSFIRMIPDLIRRAGERPAQAMGSVLLDPNGTVGDLDAIAHLNRVCPRLDLIINWNSSIYKRLDCSPVHTSQGRLKEALQRFGKRHWLISRPIGNHRFAILVGRNYLTGDHKSMGIHRLDSPQGQSLLEELHYTVNERREKAQCLQECLF